MITSNNKGQCSVYSNPKGEIRQVFIKSSNPSLLYQTILGFTYDNEEKEKKIFWKKRTFVKLKERLCHI